MGKFIIIGFIVLIVMSVYALCRVSGTRGE